MPTLTPSSQDISTLKIHKFPSKDAFDAAIAQGIIQANSKDISFVAGDSDSLPVYSSSDAGKALMVDSTGQLYWGSAGGGLQTI